MKNSRIPKDSRIPTMKYSRKNRTWAWQSIPAFQNERTNLFSSGSALTYWDPQRVQKKRLHQQQWEYSSNWTGSCREFLQCSHECHLRSFEPCDKESWSSQVEWTNQKSSCNNKASSFQKNGTDDTEESNLEFRRKQHWLEFSSEFMILSIPHACGRISACEAIQISVFHF